MAEIRWIKIVTDVFDDEKILMIESMPDADSIIVIWFKMLCLAGKQNNSGVFVMGRIPYTDEMFSTIFRRPLNTIRLALRTFEDFGMIEIINNTVTIPNWDKHQSLDAYEKKKERDRLYQAERRAAQKLIAEKSSDKSSDVASQNRLDKNRKEEDKDKKKKKSAKADFNTCILNYAQSKDDSERADITDLLLEWLNVRKAKRAAMTERAIQLNLDKLDQLAVESGMSVIEYLQEVICRGWAAFYKISNFDNKRGNTFPNTSGGIDVFDELLEEERARRDF